MQKDISPCALILPLVITNNYIYNYAINVILTILTTYAILR